MREGLQRQRDPRRLILVYKAKCLCLSNSWCWKEPKHIYLTTFILFYTFNLLIFLAEGLWGGRFCRHYRGVCSFGDRRSLFIQTVFLDYEVPRIIGRIKQKQSVSWLLEKCSSKFFSLQNPSHLIGCSAWQSSDILYGEDVYSLTDLKKIIHP